MSNFDLLSKKISGIDAVIDAWISKLGIGYNHYAVLHALARADAQQQPRTQKQISEEWLIPKQTVFNICKDYKAKGWLAFGENPADKRERLLHLTEAGQAQARPVWLATQELSGRTFEQFGAEKTARLFALMDEFCEIAQWQIARTKTGETDGES
jgi:transcriptional regulator, MarR family